MVRQADKAVGTSMLPAHAAPGPYDPSRMRTLLAACLMILLHAAAAARGQTGELWSLRPPRTPAATTGTVAELAATLDRFVAARRQVAGLSAAPPADRRTLARRLFLDLHGLPPSPEELRRFRRDTQPDAYARLVERLLASPRYGERWAQHWLDVVRYADTHGFEVNTPRPNAWPYRDWVIRAFNDDKPYDAFVREQIVGDAVGQDAATGFLVAGPAVLPGQIGKDEPSRRQARQDELDEIVKATSGAFLGLTVGCARCHDHKTDPIRQEEYYALQAVFAGVRYGERRLPDPIRERKAVAARERIGRLRRALAEYEPLVASGRTILIDDEAAGATLLAAKAGHGENPTGEARGHHGDVGGPARMPNLGRGRYTWWRDGAGRDLIAYRPAARGRFRVWVSWGCGWRTHTRAAHWILDADGDPKTRDDQRTIATVDQQAFAGGGGADRSQPLWSGLHDAGVHDLEEASAILLRGGPGVATTADVIVLQEARGRATPALPRLRRPVDARHNVERFPAVRARYVRFRSYATNSEREPCLDELEVFTATDPARNVARGAQATASGSYRGNPRHRLAHLNDGRYGNERSWISNEPGRGWAQVELAEPAVIDRIVWSRDRNGRYADRLPLRYEIAVAEKPGDWRVVASSDDRVPFGAAPAEALAYRFAGLPQARSARARALVTELAAATALHAKLAAGKRVFAGTFTAPGPTKNLHRGNPMRPQEVVAPGVPRALGALALAADAPERDRRAALARWLVSEDHPLTARVAVNRVWQHHFGTGIVRTPSDFGHSGAPPSHPRLLDWLALVLMENGWSLKHVHRVILRSETYRQASTPRARGLRVDAGNRLLWRFAPRRLEAEAIRDSILAVSGALDLGTGGPGFGLFVPNTNYVRVYEPKESWTPETFRRMVYAHKVRMERDGVFGAFDCPDAGQAAPVRGRSTTALQALNLFNSTFVLQQAKLFAKRVEREAGRGERVRRAFALTLGREPTAREAAAAARVVRRHGLPTLARVLFNTNEFVFLP